MTRPIKDTMRKSLRRGSRKVATSLKRPSSKLKGRAALAAGVAAASAAGVAAAAHFLRNGGDHLTTFHVVPGEKGWILKTEENDRPLKVFDTKRQAVSAARSTARASSPSQLTIHGTDGTPTASHRYDRT
jgi:hypothetical protein